jgi:hypothetical protein
LGRGNAITAVGREHAQLVLKQTTFETASQAVAQAMFWQVSLSRKSLSGIKSRDHPGRDLERRVARLLAQAQT